MSWFQKCVIFLANIENVVLLRCHLDGAALHFHQKTIRPVQKATHPCSLKVHGRRRLTWLAGCNQHAGRPAPHRCNSYVGGPVRGVLTVNACDGNKRATAMSCIHVSHTCAYRSMLIRGRPAVRWLLVQSHRAACTHIQRKRSAPATEPSHTEHTCAPSPQYSE